MLAISIKMIKARNESIKMENIGGKNKKNKGRKPECIIIRVCEG